MILTGRRIIERFARKHRDATQWLAEWIRNAEAAQWRSIRDVRKLYPATDGAVKTAQGKFVTVFNVKGHEYRLIVDIIFAAGVVSVLD